MEKRILPIYFTGWFYLILLFWGVIYCYVAAGGLNQVNQLTLDLLSKTSPSPTLPSNRNTLTTNNILTAKNVLTLHSTFNNEGLVAVRKLLAYQPHSQIALLGNQSKNFINGLQKSLIKAPRRNKIIIASSNSSSENPIKINSSMPFSPVLNWFRLSEQQNLKTVSSPHFIFSPLLMNQRQSFPIFWQQKNEIYLTLPGQVLKQLHRDNTFSIKQQWQLSLINPQNTFFSNELLLGFFGEVFTSGNAYDLDHYPSQIVNPQWANIYTTNTIHRTLEKTTLLSVNQFIKQNLDTNLNSNLKNNPNSNSHKNSNQNLEKSTNSAVQYKVIIITDQSTPSSELLKPLLIQLTDDSYLSQSILTLLLSWILGAIGLILIWLIRHLSFKHQFISILTYGLILFILQYFKFTQQQWLEILPAFILVSCTWGLFLAYQKETAMFLITLVDHTSHAQSQIPTKTRTAKSTQQIEKKTNKSNEQDYKSAQNFSPAATVITPAPLFSKPIKKPSTPIEELDQTLVIVDNKIPQATKKNHHVTVENFGRYQIEGILGKGAMGIVYQGVDPKINRHVAIKTLQLSDDIDSPEFNEAKERFFREAQTAGGLSHANIVTIYDVGEENNLGYIAMDLLTGAPLSLFTQLGQTLPVPLIYQLLIQITDALDYAHNQNVVHRDIKPANIIYDDDLLKVTVTDFGIAYVSDNSKTRTGIIMGSPYYMSPEQILGLKVDGRSDIFSLGVTFYQLLCGHLPFEGESIASVAYQITKAKPIPVNQRNTELPASALRITNKAMHKDIEKRYQSMDEFKLALINALKRDFKIT